MTAPNNVDDVMSRIEETLTSALSTPIFFYFGSLFSAIKLYRQGVGF